MSQKSPQDLFPNLFGAKAQKVEAKPMRAQDMRLLQYCMRQASKSRPGLNTGARPAIRRAAASQAPAARFPGATR